jgi:hypothetical protein
MARGIQSRVFSEAWEREMFDLLVAHPHRIGVLERLQTIAWKASYNGSVEWSASLYDLTIKIQFRRDEARGRA